MRAVKKEAIRFIHCEQERILQNLRNGSVCRENALGGLSTLFQIASHIKNKDYMKSLCVLIAQIRSEKHMFNSPERMAPIQAGPAELIVRQTNAAH
jgi:hypothetical protein